MQKYSDLRIFTFWDILASRLSTPLGNTPPIACQSPNIEPILLRIALLLSVYKYFNYVPMIIFIMPLNFGHAIFSHFRSIVLCLYQDFWLSGLRLIEIMPLGICLKKIKYVFLSRCYTFIVVLQSIIRGFGMGAGSPKRPSPTEIGKIVGENWFYFPVYILSKKKQKSQK